jgi:hypothetical protein
VVGTSRRLKRPESVRLWWTWQLANVGGGRICTVFLAAVAFTFACQPVRGNHEIGAAAEDDGSRDQTAPKQPLDLGPPPRCAMSPGQTRGAALPSECRLRPSTHHPEARLEDCSRRVTAEHPLGSIRPLEWKLQVASTLLPGLRIYRASDRYPRALSIDLVAGYEVESINLPLVNLRLHERGLVPTSDSEIRELATFVVLAENEPYSAENLTVTLRPTSDDITAEVRFQTTTPWSPPDDPSLDRRTNIVRMMTAGAKLAEYVTRLSFTRDGCIVYLGTEETRVIETRP